MRTPRSILLTSALATLLYAPLVGYAWKLRETAGGGADVLGLPLTDQLVLVFLLIGPLMLLSRLGIRWNPAKAQNAEYPDF
jgi:hypothetical protein